MRRSIIAFATANFVSAVGSGTLLSMGVKVMGVPLLLGGNVLAFLIGTVLGLLFLLRMKSAWNRFARVVFDLACCCASMLLYIVWSTSSHDNSIRGPSAYVFFGLLCVRFTFSFVPRALRSSAAAGYRMRLAYVELSTYGGTILGLLLWLPFSLLAGWPLASILALDSVLQLIASVADAAGYPLGTFATADVAPMRTGTGNARVAIRYLSLMCGFLLKPIIIPG